MDAEVIVVGGGPAGSHLARRLAEAGREVVLLDRARFPRDKVCGGGVSVKAAHLVGGLPPALLRATVSGALISHRNRWLVEVMLGRPAGFMVTRRELDHWLLERARWAGAVVHQGVAYQDHRVTGRGVEVACDAGRWRARLLVGADGAASRVRRRLVGQAQRLNQPALEVLLPGGGRSALAGRALFDLGAVPGGYGWIFPKGDHLNVGVFSGVGPGVRRSHLRAFLRRYRLEEAGGRRLGYPIPLDGARGPWEGPGVWLVGDAAGLAEPMLGEGIYHALLSAEIAAELIISGETAPGRYSQAVRRRLVPELRAARRLARCLFPCAAPVVRYLARRPRFSRRFTALMTGELGFRRCWRETWLGLPLSCLAAPSLPLRGPLWFESQPTG